MRRLQIGALRVAELLRRGCLAGRVRAHQEWVDVHACAHLAGVATTRVAASTIAIEEKRVTIDGEVQLLGGEAGGVTGSVVAD